MKGSQNQEIAAWETEGGAVPAPVRLRVNSLSGSASQVEWAERIRLQVDAEFDRVAASFRTIAERQDGGKRANTEAVLAILEDKRAEVMNRDQAGYFIRVWQEITDQVRQMIVGDPRYQTVQSRRKALRGREEAHWSAAQDATATSERRR